ncbi:MAG: mu-protocadherin-cell-suface protein [Candidatus Sumerlaeia bacterium]
MSQLPSGNRGQIAQTRPGAGGAGVSKLPSTRPGGIGERPGVGTRPGAGGAGVAQQPAQRRQDVGNFLGVAAGAGAGIAAAGGIRDVANRPGARGGGVQYQRPDQRPNWNNWSQNRNQNWNQAVDNRQNYWNDWSGRRQQNLNDFRQNQDQRWNNVQNRYDNRQDWFSNRADNWQDWRVDNREDWQDYRQDMWDYRWDRADDLWDDVRDYRDDLFDDYWWGACGWGAAYYPPAYQYPQNPWWWWQPTAWTTVSSIVSQPQQPVYYDYGVTVINEGDQVYQNGQPPVSATDYTFQAVALSEVDQPPPPAPPDPETSATAAQEWMPLGVWALTQQDKGDATMFFQLSVNRDGLISGGFQNVMTGESKPVAGSVDKQSQRAAWRIGANKSMVVETGLFNLTEDVTPVSIHFGTTTQTWLMVRLPAPEMPGAPTKVDTTGKRELPPIMGESKATAPAN